MRPLRQIQKQYVVIAALGLWLTLACGPLDRLRTVNQQPQTTITGAANIRDNSHLAAEAYQKIETLPGYRLEIRHTIRSKTGQPASQTVIKEYDPAGNVYTRSQMDDGSQTESYHIVGQTYRFDPQYDGWINLGTATPADLPPDGEISLTASMQLLTQYGAAPTEAGHEMVNNRPATRYRLDYMVTELAELFGQEPANTPLELRGTLWLDDETGALLKSEILLYQGQADQPAQEFVLEISQIGQIKPIAVPRPVVDSKAIVTATATAEAWNVLNINLVYGDEQLSFEVIPLQVSQVPNSSPRRADMQLILRQLPDKLFRELEPFLAYLQGQLTLSIPKRNLVITSSGYTLENSNAAEQTLTVTYSFKADLEDFSHVELIIAGVGNPLFAPVPVENNEQ